MVRIYSNTRGHWNNHCAFAPQKDQIPGQTRDIMEIEAPAMIRRREHSRTIIDAWPGCWTARRASMELLAGKSLRPEGARQRLDAGYTPWPVGPRRRAPKHRRERNGYKQHRYISGVQIPSYDPTLVRREREVRCRETGCGVPEYRRPARSESEPVVALPVSDTPGKGGSWSRKTTWQGA
jgi:hypothetical protein